MRRAVLAVCGLGIALTGCEFQPVVRPVVLRRMASAPTRVVRALDANGEAVLVQEARDGRGERYGIAHWYTHSHCVLPDDTVRVYDPVPDAADDALRLPIARHDGAQHSLWLSDAHCGLTGPLAALAPDTLLALTSAVDQRSLLVFRDPSSTLYVLDLARSPEARPIASDVAEVVPATVNGDPVDDALWLREAGHVTERRLDGSLVVSLGDAVSEFSLYDSLTPRVAYVDGGDLYEALPPRYAPVLRAEDACAPHYDKSALNLYAPCGGQQLLRVALSTGALQRFAPGVSGSITLGALQFDAVADAPDASPALYVESSGLPRQRVEPALALDSLRALDSQRVVGRTADGELGIWSVATQRFTPLFHGVDSVTPYDDPSTDEAWWVVHHQSDARGLGALSTLRLDDGSIRHVAVGVPREADGGFAVVMGAILADFATPKPLLVFLADAHPLGRDGHAAGRLRAELLGAALGADLTDDASSYATVAKPVPGVLVGVEEGPRAGLWFGAL